MAETTGSTAVRDPERLRGTLRKLTDKAARRRRDLPPHQVLLQAPGFEFSSGDRARKFHAASVGKMMTATLAFLLAEEGRLDLDASIPSVLPAEDFAGLFVRDGHDGSGAVTIRHLLTHTSGVADYFEGATTSGPRFLAQVLAEPDRRYRPADLLAFSRDHQAPVGAPGERFLYSDTGYALAARALEEVSGSSLGSLLHERIFGPVGMADSCMAFYTMPGGGPCEVANPGEVLDIAPLVVEGRDLSRAGAVSCDWGGGGVIATLDDLARFSTAWHAGALISASSRAQMATFSRKYRAGIHYGAGLMQLRYGGFFFLLGSMPSTVGHLGITGVHLFTEPQRGITLVLNAHSTKEMVRSFRLHIALMQATVRATA